MEDGLGVRISFDGKRIYTYVLILVLMEDGLGEPGKNTHPVTIDQVLILVLMEDGLGVYHTLVRTSSMGES